MTLRTLVAGAATLGALAAGGATGALAVNGQGSSEAQYSVNSSGKSYGTLPGKKSNLPPPSVEEMPDLVAVVGEGNVEGYAYKTELFGEDREPASPEEALRDQSNRRVDFINVYESDGKTVIGKMRVGPDSP